MQLHLVAAVIAILASALLGVSPVEWMLIATAITFVLSAECINTGIERLADRVSADDDPLIRQCKDATAAGVLIAALFSLVIGGIVFLPRVIEILWN